MSLPPADRQDDLSHRALRRTRGDSAIESVASEQPIPAGEAAGMVSRRSPLRAGECPRRGWQRRRGFCLPGAPGEGPETRTTHKGLCSQSASTLLLNKPLLRHALGNPYRDGRNIVGDEWPAILLQIGRASCRERV